MRASTKKMTVAQKNEMLRINANLKLRKKKRGSSQQEGLACSAGNN